MFFFLFPFEIQNKKAPQCTFFPLLPRRSMQVQRVGAHLHILLLILFKTTWALLQT